MVYEWPGLGNLNELGGVVGNLNKYFVQFRVTYYNAVLTRIELY